MDYSNRMRNVCFGAGEPICLSLRVPAFDEYKQQLDDFNEQGRYTSDDCRAIAQCGDRGMSSFQSPSACEMS